MGSVYALSSCSNRSRIIVVSVDFLVVESPIAYVSMLHFIIGFVEEVGFAGRFTASRCLLEALFDQLVHLCNALAHLRFIIEIRKVI